MAGTLSITNDNFQAGTAIVASEMNTNFTEVENYINNSMPSLGTASVFTAAVTCNAGFTSTTVTTSGELKVQDQACIRDDATPATITDRLLTLRTQTSGMVPLLALAETAVSGTTPVAGIFMIGVEDDGTNPDMVDVFATSSEITLANANALKLGDADTSAYVGLDAPSTVSGSYTITLPAAVASGADYALTTSDSSGNMQWTATSGFGISTGKALVLAMLF